MGFCLGASMAGMKAMTATSGPGLSLYSEQISFAIASEIPIVIVDVQRLGPSTGSATRGADGDIQFLRWGNSGGLPVVVLAPVDASDCVLLTMHAFNLSEEYRCPVFVASNKEVGSTKESIDLNKLEKPLTVDRVAPPPGETYLPYAALLKVLEEPLSDTIFLLTTSRKEKLPPTIISRRQSVRCDTLREEDIERALSNGNIFLRNRHSSSRVSPAAIIGTRWIYSRRMLFHNGRKLSNSFVQSLAGAETAGRD